MIRPCSFFDHGTPLLAMISDSDPLHREYGLLGGPSQSLASSTAARTKSWCSPPLLKAPEQVKASAVAPMKPARHLTVKAAPDPYAGLITVRREENPGRRL